MKLRQVQVRPLRPRTMLADHARVVRLHRVLQERERSLLAVHVHHVPPDHAGPFVIRSLVEPLRDADRLPPHVFALPR